MATSTSMERVCFEVAERGELVVPCPLVSRERPQFSFDGASPVAQQDAPWVALHAGVGPAKLLLSWAVAHAGGPTPLERIPPAYVIETSASSTDGHDGQWRRELSVVRNSASTRAHVIEFDGQSWVRLTLADGFSGSALRLDRLDLHDASDGTDDCWLVLGDPRLVGLARAPSASGGRVPGWAELIHERYPGYFPALLDETRLGERPVRTLERIDELLATHSPASRVALAYAGASMGEADAQALEAIVAAVRQSGRVPVLARLPAAGARAPDDTSALNRCIAAVEQRYELVPGPDLRAWFDAHPDQVEAEGEPSREGRLGIASLWADAVDVWYVPQ